MILKKGQLPILIFNLIALAIFGIIFTFRRNYEFILYIGVIILFLLIILLTNRKVDYPLPVLWGLSLWALMHLSGGGILIDGERLYNMMLISLTEEIFRYDQLVHIIGFGVATLVMYYLLRPSLKDERRKVSIAIVVVMAGLGVGALNEIVEFAVTIIVPESGVGGYTNTSLDLVSDLIGAVIAYFYIRLQGR